MPNPYIHHSYADPTQKLPLSADAIPGRLETPFDYRHAGFPAILNPVIDQLSSLSALPFFPTFGNILCYLTVFVSHSFPFRLVTTAD